MIHARIHQGRVEVDEPIPRSWEGRTVKIVPLTPDDPLPDLEGRLARRIWMDNSWCGVNNPA